MSISIREPRSNTLLAIFEGYIQAQDILKFFSQIEDHAYRFFIADPSQMVYDENSFIDLGQDSKNREIIASFDKVVVVLSTGHPLRNMLLRMAQQASLGEKILFACTREMAIAMLQSAHTA